MTIVPQHHSSIVGGSTAARRIGCPRSYALEQLVPQDDKGSSYAQEGTALHELMAIALAQDVEPTTRLPFTYTAPADKGGWSFTVTAEIWADKGEPALAAFDAFVAEQEAKHGEPMRIIVETRVEWPHVKGAFGTSDIIGRCGDTTYVMDWKFGNGVVPATDNKQLLFYASGALNSAKDFIGETDWDTPLTVAIIQPTRDPIIEAWHTTWESVFGFDTQLYDAIKLVWEKGDQAPVAEGSWCKFARCKTVCPLHFNAANKLAARWADLKDRTSPTRPNSQGDWSQRYGELLNLADMVEALVGEIRTQAHAYAEAGLPIDGFALEPKRAGGRSWAVEEEAVQKWMRRRGYKIDTYMARKLMTLPQVEKILKRDSVDMPAHFVKAGESSGTKLVRIENAKNPIQPTPSAIGTLAERLQKLGGAA
jgi:hypothetical protein